LTNRLCRRRETESSAIESRGRKEGRKGEKTSAAIAKRWYRETIVTWWQRRAHENGLFIELPSRPFFAYKQEKRCATTNENYFMAK